MPVGSDPARTVQVVIHTRTTTGQPPGPGPHPPRAGNGRQLLAAGGHDGGQTAGGGPEAVQPGPPTGSSRQHGAVQARNRGDGLAARSPDRDPTGAWGDSPIPVSRPGLSQHHDTDSPVLVIRPTETGESHSRTDSSPAPGLRGLQRPGAAGTHHPGRGDQDDGQAQRTGARASRRGRARPSTATVLTVMRLQLLGCGLVACSGWSGPGAGVGGAIGTGAGRGRCCGGQAGSVG
ncbi:hypothetical protein J2S46_007999 [Kitasatospora herbaricolor]|nr:hypothetical protein [Kitasatospora herbaricolor]